MKAHKLAKLFPEIPKEEFAQMVADVKEHGQIEPIWIYEGQVLDGWHRYQAAVAAGKEPKTREWKGDDPVAFVRSVNLMRRHLSDREKSLADSNLLTQTGRRYHGHSPVQTDGLKTTPQRAEESGVDQGTITKANAIVDHAPETTDLVLRREMGFDAALSLAWRAAKAKTEPQRKAIVERGIAAANRPKARRKKSSKKTRGPKSFSATAEVKWLIDYLKAWKSVLEKDALVALKQGKFSPEAASFFARRLRYVFEPVAKEFETWATKHGRRK